MNQTTNQTNQTNAARPSRYLLSKVEPYGNTPINIKFDDEGAPEYAVLGTSSIPEPLRRSTLTKLIALRGLVPWTRAKFNQAGRIRAYRVNSAMLVDGRTNRKPPY